MRNVKSSEIGSASPSEGRDAACRIVHSAASLEETWRLWCLALETSGDRADEHSRSLRVLAGPPGGFFGQPLDKPEGRWVEVGRGVKVFGSVRYQDTRIPPLAAGNGRYRRHDAAARPHAA